MREALKERIYKQMEKLRILADNRKSQMEENPQGLDNIAANAYNDALDKLRHVVGDVVNLPKKELVKAEPTDESLKQDKKIRNTKEKVNDSNEPTPEAERQNPRTKM